MCIFGRKLRNRIKELEAEVKNREADIDNLNQAVRERDTEIERLKKELHQTPVRGANGRYTKRKAL